MTIEEMKESIIKLAEHLLKVGDRLNNHLLSPDKTSMSSWGMVWLLMIGACYSLGKAQPFLDKSRDPQDQINAAKKLLSQIIKEEELNLINEEDCSSWVVGYHLYSAEQRISTALDRLVKTLFKETKINVYNKRTKTTYDKIQIILELCERFPISCLTKSKQILRKFNPSEYRKLREIPDQFYSDISEGGCLNRVWFRANDIKHCQIEETNPENPLRRWEDAYKALKALIQIFEDFGTQDYIMNVHFL